MNWKLNYWTLLFAVSGIWILYNRLTCDCHAGKATNAVAVTTDIDSCPPLTIDSTKAKLDISRLKRLGMNNIRVKNGKTIESFMLAKCELQEMLAFKDPNKKAIAMLAIDSISPDSMLVDIYFRVINSRGQAAYYDFSTPCPPICGSGGD